MTHTIHVYGRYHGCILWKTDGGGQTNRFSETKRFVWVGDKVVFIKYLEWARNQTKSFIRSCVVF